MADEEGVTVPDSPPDETISEQTAPAAVTADRVDRPVENAVAEFNRKYEQLKRQLNDVLAYVATQRSPQPQAPPSQEVSDEDLWRLAQQGDRSAFDLYMDRKASRVAQTQIQGQNYNRLIEAQLAALSAKYPVFNDPSHPLTQAANQAYALLVQQGAPATRATLLDAVKTAIADRDDLVSELRATRTSAPSALRQSAATRAQAGVTGATHRENAAPVTPAPRITPAEADLARRMGIKDPAKAKERFLKRNANGESSLGSVAAFVNDKDF